MRNDAYVNGKKIGCNQTSARLTDLKKQDGFSFQKDVDSIALQQSLRDLDRGFKNFFEKRARHPQFKSKHNNHQSYRTINQGDNIRIIGKYIRLPKPGYVKIRQSMETRHISNVTIEHTPAGGKVTLGAEDMGLYKKLTVSDNGCGIDEKDLPHIFERFYRGKNSGENSIGIGLALSKTIIEKQGGFISADSAAGKGSQFTIKLDFK